MWIDMYVGSPDIIKTDASKSFVAAEFINSAKSLAIEVKEVSVEAHYSMGKVERYYATIRRAYKVISSDVRRTTASKHILQIAVKAVNNTAGSNSLIPTLLVFSAYSRLLQTLPLSASITARGAAVYKAMAEVRRIKAKR
jgi:hypothetical protein